MQRILQALLLIIPVLSFSQSFPKIEDKTKGLKKYEGYFDYYWDEKEGKVWLDIPRIDTEFLYVNTMPAGVGSNDLSLDRGTIRASRIVKFTRTGPKLLLIEPNQNFRAISGTPAEKHTVELAFAQSTLWGFTIVAETNNHVLVDATDFFLRDALRVGSQLGEMQQGRYEFSASRSAMYLPNCKNFPFNTELEATITLVLGPGSAGNYLRSVTPSQEAVTIRNHFSFVQLPDAGYKMRVADPRSSFIEKQYFDYSTPVYEPIDKHYINRFRLEKKDPNAAKSEAVKPIIYYLDNGTPEPIRSALLEGGKWWNQAFEAAGYIDAFQIKILPEDADPMDIRYNMINWVHRSTRGWSFGSYVEDPRTGEIIKGNVTLGSLRVRQDYLIATGLLTPFENGLPADNKMMTMAVARLRQLSAHEIGHTIGLQHNFSASTVHNSSVMDYPHPMVSFDASGNIDISKAYPEGIGDWDKVSIAYGYQDFPKGVDEKKALDKIMSDAYKSGLEFISDGDARPAGSLHPTAHLWDNGSDIVAELNNVMKIRKKALENFSEKNIRPGMPMAELEEVLVPIYLFHRYQVEAATKLVGSMYYSYALRGDGQIVTKTVSKAEQQKALTAVISTVDPAFLLIPEKILQLIPPRPSGYDPTRELFKKKTGLVLDALAPAETAADMPIKFLFNEERINRLVQQDARNGGLSLNEMITQLINATWKAKRRTGVEGLIQLQTEQIMLTYLLSASIDADVSFVAQGVLLQQIEQLKKYIVAQQKISTDPVYNGHLLLALSRLAHPEKAMPTLIAPIPPGSPIGDE